jgi:ZIP family zinc transporter
MANLLVFLALTTAMGLAIFLSLPVVMSRRMQGRAAIVLNAIALGILVFLLADIWGNVSTILTAQEPLFLTVPSYDAVFLAAAVGAFAALFAIDLRSGQSLAESPVETSFIIAVAMGFQNLTEGLVFGAAWVAGAVSLSLVIFVGFVLQNISEGFPIAAPLLGTKERNVSRLATFFLIGGLPSVLGGAIGYFFHPTLLELVFNSAALGAILYVILQMFRAVFRPAETREATKARNRLVYYGIVGGFVLGFVVNAF